ncbi:hypothetical protein G7Y89_g14573 [Cudoniella acicularis]|uniref:Uncharacterized protein n=1 Tax=Cudoniella acicularis TaxID=354080 RepID=A0A8H4R498_9HELO|nr:hypothetical protein G7Y89_g14573 [Cudoniella acicularis]
MQDYNKPSTLKLRNEVASRVMHTRGNRQDMVLRLLDDDNDKRPPFRNNVYHDANDPTRAFRGLVVGGGQAHITEAGEVSQSPNTARLPSMNNDDRSIFSEVSSSLGLSEDTAEGIIEEDLTSKVDPNLMPKLKHTNDEPNTVDDMNENTTEYHSHFDIVHRSRTPTPKQLVDPLDISDDPWEHLKVTVEEDSSSKVGPRAFLMPKQAINGFNIVKKIDNAEIESENDGDENDNKSADKDKLPGLVSNKDFETMLRSDSYIFLSGHVHEVRGDRVAILKKTASSIAKGVAPLLVIRYAYVDKIGYYIVMDSDSLGPCHQYAWQFLEALEKLSFFGKSYRPILHLYTNSAI